MAQIYEATLQRYAVRDGRRLAKNLFGGALILAIWLALWAWLALGVVRPVSSTAAGLAAAELVEHA
jgi:F0F1-type ATP synthase membrane subunit a